MATAVLTSSLDAYIDANDPTTNFGSTSGCQVNAVTGGFRRRGIVCFNTSPIPANATISAATLTIECITAAAGVGTAICELMVIEGMPGTTEPLIESETTWNNRTAAQAWGSAGGDIEGGIAGTSFATPIATGVLPDIDVKDMLISARDNYLYPTQVGFIIRQSVTARSWTFASKDGVGKTVPTLTITYTAPVVAPASRPFSNSVSRLHHSRAFNSSSRNKRAFD